MTLPSIRLKKGEDRRVRSGHPWIYSNEINTTLTPLKSFAPGDEVIVASHDDTYLGVAYLNPHSLITGRIISADYKDRLTPDFFVTKFKAALLLRDGLFSKPFYRLVFSEADGLPGLIVDRYADDLVLQINTAGMQRHENSIIEALRAVLPATRSILLRNDSPIREQEGLETSVTAAWGEPPEVITIEENGTLFSVPLWKGQKTGWFYDHRMNRARLQAYVAGKTVLDVFSYLGGWGLEAMHFGANSVDCVETSATACDFIKKNADLNHVADRVNVICDDAFDALKKLGQKKAVYDVIIIDPPAFVKKFKDRQEGLLAYQRINEMAIKLLAPNGILICCSCSMLVTMDDLILMMQRLAYRTQTKLQLLERGHQGPDHPMHICIPETDYLKALFLRKLAWDGKTNRTTVNPERM